jgi:hypothetical protein
MREQSTPQPIADLQQLQTLKNLVGQMQKDLDEIRNLSNFVEDCIKQRRVQFVTL